MSVPVVVVPDPRVATSQDDLLEQQRCLFEVMGALERTNGLIDKLARIRRQTRFWQERGILEHKLESAERIRAAVDATLPKLIDVNIHEAQLYPSGLHEKLNALFDSVDSADYAPPQQARDVFVQLVAELDEIEAGLSSELGSVIQEFNDALASSGTQAIDTLE